MREKDPLPILEAGLFIVEPDVLRLSRAIQSFPSGIGRIRGQLRDLH